MNQDKKPTNILFTCAGRRNYLVNYFKEVVAGKGQIIAVDKQLSAPALVDADIALKVPDIYSDNYIDELVEIIKNYKVSAVISLNDLELPILALAREKIELAGARLLVSSESVISIAFDKMKTADFISKIGLKSPKTYSSLEEAIHAIENGSLKFPLVLKPRWGSASIGIDFPENMNELKLSYKLQQIKLAKSILNKASSSDIDNAILIQEKLEGKEFGMDVINDFKGNYYGTFIREKLSMRSGETDKAISVIDDRFENVGKKIGENLGHIGTMDCDAFVVDGELYVLELNPRFGGGYPFSHEAGINTAGIYVEWLNGNVDVSKFNNYRSGVLFSKCDRLLRIKG